MSSIGILSVPDLLNVDTEGTSVCRLAGSEGSLGFGMLDVHGCCCRDRSSQSGRRSGGGPGLIRFLVGGTNGLPELASSSGVSSADPSIGSIVVAGMTSGGASGPGSAVASAC